MTDPVATRWFYCELVGEKKWCPPTKEVCTYPDVEGEDCEWISTSKNPTMIAVPAFTLEYEKKYMVQARASYELADTYAYMNMTVHVGSRPPPVAVLSIASIVT